MQKRKLNYRFHNPNTAEATADYILKVLVDVNRTKIDTLLQEAVPPRQETNKPEDAAE